MNRMSNALLKTDTKLWKHRRIDNPYVCEYQPFVCSCNPVNEPFVGKNKPNTIFQFVTKGIHGFSLIELVVAMAVATILVAVAVPNMRTFIQNGRLNTHVNDLIGDLNLARSEAIKRRANVGIATSTAGTCVTGGNWRNGRVIFLDTNPADGTCNAGETILRFREPLSSSANDTLTTTAPDPIIFGANGASNLPVGATSTFNFCDDRGPGKAKQVNLNFMGRAAVMPDPPVTCP